MFYDLLKNIIENKDEEKAKLLLKIAKEVSLNYENHSSAVEILINGNENFALEVVALALYDWEYEKEVISRAMFSGMEESNDNDL